MKISVYDDYTQEFLLVDKLQIYHTNNTWISFNVTNPMNDILQKTNRERFFKVVISIKPFLPYFRDTSNKLKLSLMPLSEDYEHDYPILLLSYGSKIKSIHTQNLTRKKRGIEEDYEEETNNVWDSDPYKKTQLKKMKKIRNSCRRKPLYVNFSEIRYDSWIVQPRGYEVRFLCSVNYFYIFLYFFRPTNVKGNAFIQLQSICLQRNMQSCKLFYTVYPQLKLQDLVVYQLN